MSRDRNRLHALVDALPDTGMNLAGLSPFKNFRLHERVKPRLRAEAGGVMNHPNFSPPNVAPASSLSGSVSATRTGREERRVFVGLKLLS
jgi:hypothetical protein